MPLLGKASSTMVKACIALYTRIQLSQPVKPHFFTRTQIPATITFPSFMSKNMFLQQYFKKKKKKLENWCRMHLFFLFFFLLPKTGYPSLSFKYQQCASTARRSTAKYFLEDIFFRRCFFWNLSRNPFFLQPDACIPRNSLPLHHSYWLNICSSLPCCIKS